MVFRYHFVLWGILTAERFKQTDFSEIILTVSLLCVGAFHEFVSCILSVAMLLWLAVQAVRNKQICCYINVTSLCVIGIVLFYALSAFWAVDSGMALVGFVKYLPVLLYLLVLQQKSSPDRMFSRLPLVAAGMTVLSVIAMQIPVLAPYVSVSGRLAGFFEYPNTFALFLLVSELIVIAKEKYRAADAAVIAVLLFGLLYSGSRTVFVLAVLSNAVLIFTGKNKRVKISVAALIALLVIGFAVYFILSGKTSAFGRFLTISLQESTFVGRLLYFKDALPVILRHPFGLGYMGYYDIQQSIQTGVYSVMFVHNDFLQLMLDIGWIPALLFIAAIMKSIFSGKKPLYKRVILGVMALHGCFDFNLQFVAMFMLLLLFTDYAAGKEYTVKPRGAVVGVCSFLAAVSLYFGTSLTLSHFGAYQAAFSVYPLDTRSQTQLLLKETDLQKADAMADDILTRNESVTVAYSVKARYAYSKGDFAKVIEYKQQIFDRTTFAYEEYEEYCYMLINGFALYRQAGDTYSAQICAKELKAAADSVHTAENRLSSLGAKIKDQPETQLPEDIEKYLESEVNPEK